MADSEISSLSKRVERVESKIDDMFEVMISMARAEEKLANITATLVDIRDENKKLIDKIDSLEEEVATHKEQLATAKKVTFLLLGGVISVGATVFSGLVG